VQVGDLVRLCMISYPQYDGKLGILIGRASVDEAWIVGTTAWMVVIDGMLHPYVIRTNDMVVISESR